MRAILLITLQILHHATAGSYSEIPLRGRTPDCKTVLRKSDIMTKFARLAFAALLTSIACLSYLYVFEYDRLSWNVKCWKYATSLSACYRGDEFDFAIDLNGVRYEGNTGNFIDRHIFYFGAYEKPVLFFLRDVMKSAYSNQGVFLDVGANTGQHSLFMSRHAREIHAFEPYEPVLRRFRRSIDLNRIKNIVIHPIGIGNENSKKPFFRPPDTNLGTGSFMEGFKSDNTFDGELEIQIGDEALDRAKVTSVALIKMDIEGYEKPALQGLRRTLQLNRPIVVFELSVIPDSPASIKSKSELYALFPTNYNFLMFTDKSDQFTGSYVLEDIGELIRFDKPAQYDVIAYPAERRNQIHRELDHDVSQGSR